jgi:hypothetical protein
MKTPVNTAEKHLKALETDLGEPLLFRTTGRILAAGGLEGAPVGSWGLVAITPTRVVFHHFANTHPLLGRMDSDTESRWTVDRTRFTGCTLQVPKFLSRIFSSVPDHVSLEGEGVRLSIEVADFPKNFVAAWETAVPPS